MDEYAHRFTNGPYLALLRYERVAQKGRGSGVEIGKETQEKTEIDIR